MSQQNELHNFKSFVSYLKTWIIHNLDQIPAKNHSNIELELKFGRIRDNGKDVPFDNTKFIVLSNEYRMTPAIDKKSYNKIVKQFTEETKLGSSMKKFEVRDVSEKTCLRSPLNWGRIRVDLHRNTLIESISKEKIANLLIKFPHSNYDCKLSLSIEHQVPVLAYPAFKDSNKAYSREKKGYQFIVPRSNNRLDVSNVLTKSQGEKKYESSKQEIELEMSLTRLLLYYQNRNHDAIEKEMSKFIQDGLRIKNILKTRPLTNKKR